jgi:hypothetical protein
VSTNFSKNEISLETHSINHYKNEIENYKYMIKGLHQKIELLTKEKYELLSEVDVVNNSKDIIGKQLEIVKLENMLNKKLYNEKEYELQKQLNEIKMKNFDNYTLNNNSELILIKENEELYSINENYRIIIEKLLEFINKMNMTLNKHSSTKFIDINYISNNFNEFQLKLNDLENLIISFYSYSNTNNSNKEERRNKRINEIETLNLFSEKINHKINTDNNIKTLQSKNDTKSMKITINNKFEDLFKENENLK